MIRTSRSILLVLSALAALSSCATTVVDPAATSSTTTSTTTTLPSGDTSQLLAAMMERLSGLSEIVVQTGGERARTRLGEIETLWERVRPAIERDHPAVLEDFERMMALTRLSVERRRPADADKAYVFLTPLVAAVSDRS